MNALRFQQTGGRVKTFLYVWLHVSLITTAAIAQSTDSQFIEGLRQRRLFDLASSYCREELSRSELNPLDRSELTGQLIRVYGEQAMHAAPEERSRWWQAAHQVAAEFAATYKNHPRLLVIRAQDAFVLCAEGDLLRQEAEAARGETGEQFTQALEALRRAAKSLQQLDEDLAKALPAAPKLAQGPELAADELFALRNHLRIELAKVHRQRGLCYPESPDRIAAVSEALEPLEAALSQLPAEDSLALRARLEQAICYRMLGNATDAERTLQKLVAANTPQDLAAAIRAEEIRLALASNRPPEAIQKATENLPQDATGNPEFVLARLEAIIAQWQLASNTDESQAETWRSQAVALTRFIEQNHGGYWGRRAERLLLRSAAGGSLSGDVEILRRRADDFYHQGRLPDAISAYDEAADAAATAGLVDEEFLCRFRAALVAQKTAEIESALQRFQTLALKLPTHTQAAAAHFEAIKMAVELARNDPSQLERYEQLLLEHLDHWAAAETADQARLWLGMYYRHAERWQEAAAVYTAVSPNSPHSVEAAIGTTRIFLEHAPDRTSEALPLLENAASTSQVRDNPQLRDEVESLIIACLAVDPSRQRDAAARLQQWQSQDPALVFSLADNLGDISESLPASQRRSLAELQLQLVERLRPVTRDPKAAKRLLRIEGLALAATGERERALSVFAQLAKQLPQDGRVQLEYARLLDGGNNPAASQASLTQWTNVARHSKPRSDAWYEAKCGVARARLTLGDAQQASEVLQFVLATSAPPAGSRWDKTLRELLTQAQAAQ